MFGGNTMWKEITNSKDTDQPFYCSDELIEQGVNDFRPILEKAGVFGPKNDKKNTISQIKKGISTVIHRARTKHAYKSRHEARSKRYKVFHDDN
jgi:hypothetical protein